MLFLNMLTVRKDDSRVKLLVYRKKTHTDTWTSLHIIHYSIPVS